MLDLSEILKASCTNSVRYKKRTRCLFMMVVADLDSWKRLSVSIPVNSSPVLQIDIYV